MTKTIKTIIRFTKESHLDEKLIRAVVRQIGGWESFTNSAEDVARYGADGGFSGFVYYSDTVPFAKRHRDVILGLCKDMASDFGNDDEFSLIAGFNCIGLSAGEVARGLYESGSEDQTTVYNALAWFALEEVCRSYADLIETL